MQSTLKKLDDQATKTREEAKQYEHKRDQALLEDNPNLAYKNQQQAETAHHQANRYQALGDRLSHLTSDQRNR